MALNFEKIILILDDEEEIPQLVRKELGADIQVLHFFTAAEFQSYIDRSSIVEDATIALIDIALGRDTEAGFRAAHYLTENEIHIPIIFISESSLTRDIARSAEAGSHAYIKKERLRRYPADLNAAIAQAEGARLRQEKARVGKLNEWGNRAVVLVGSLGHDIQGLISPMLSQVLALKQRASDAQRLDREVVTRAADRIIEDLERAQSLLNNAFGFIRGERDALVRTKIDIVKCVSDLIDRFAGERPLIRLVEICDSKIVHADQSRIRQMVFNLISNAQKYAADGQFVDISVTTDNGFVDVRIRDYGSTKLSRREARRIWLPLERGENPLGEGGGVGLAIVSEFAKMHGGDSYHEHPKDGSAGNIFGFRVPLASLESAVAKVSAKNGS